MGTSLLVCPRCAGCCDSRELPGRDRPGWFNPRRVVCPTCAFHRTWAERGITRRSARIARDDYFDLPFWLVTSIRGRCVWALHLDHLDWMIGFVGADLRERRAHPQWGWANRSAASRLPAWLKQSKRRSEIVDALTALRATAPAWASARAQASKIAATDTLTSGNARGAIDCVTPNVSTWR